MVIQYSCEVVEDMNNSYIWLHHVGSLNTLLAFKPIVSSGMNTMRLDFRTMGVWYWHLSVLALLGSAAAETCQCSSTQLGIL